MTKSRLVSSAAWGVCLLPFCLVTGSAQDLRVNHFSIIHGVGANGEGQGGRLDWSWSKTLIAYDKLESDTFYKVHTMSPDGTGDTCITCKVPQFPYNMGSPRWSPDGRWILVVAQRSVPPSGENKVARPGVGALNDVWVIDTSAGPNFKYYKLRDTSSYPGEGGALHPVFSHKGDKVLWVERTSPDQPDAAGTWDMYLADFTVDASGVPSLKNPTKLEAKGSNATFYESHNFSLDDTKVTFTANVGGTSELKQGGDVVIMDIATGQWTDLTNTPNFWDEHLHPIPGTTKYIWMSAFQTYGYKPGDALKTEFWMADGDGGNKHKLTWFNDTRFARASSDTPWNAVGGGVVADLSFGPPGADGVPKQVMIYCIPNGGNLGNTGINILMDIEPSATSLNAASFFRPPLAANSFISIFSATSSLATTTASGSVGSSGDYGTNLGGTTVTVTDAQGTERLAPLVYVTPLTATTASQVNMIIPDGTAPGPADVKITASDNTVTQETYTIESTSPAIFAATYRGEGPAAAYTQTENVDGIAYTFASQGGEVANSGIDVSGGKTHLSLFGTGIRGASQVSVALTPVNGGTTTVILPEFARGQGEFPALDQVVLLLPAALGGQNQDFNVVLAADGVAANTVTIHIK